MSDEEILQKIDNIKYNMNLKNRYNEKEKKRINIKKNEIINKLKKNEENVKIIISEKIKEKTNKEKKMEMYQNIYNNL